MIQLVCFLHRRPDLSPADFDRHWRERHGPLIAGLPDLARHVARYEQNPRLASDYVREAGRDEPGFDGVTIMHFESVAAYDAYANHPLYEREIAPDEEEFLDRPQSTWFLASEGDRIFGSERDEARAGVKLLALLRRRADLSIDAFHAHWGGRTPRSSATRRRCARASSATDRITGSATTTTARRRSPGTAPRSSGTRRSRISRPAPAGPPSKRTWSPTRCGFWTATRRASCSARRHDGSSREDRTTRVRGRI